MRLPTREEFREVLFREFGSYEQADRILDLMKENGIHLPRGGWPGYNISATGPFKG